MTWASLNRYSRGHKRDPEGHRRTPYRSVHAVGPASRLSASLRRFEGRVFSQNAVGSCGGHAYAKGAKIGLASQGMAMPFEDFSPRIWYALARLIDAPGKPLWDRGSEPNALQRAGQEWGAAPMGPVVPEGYSDCNPANCNDVPVLKDLELAAQRLVIGEYSLYGDDEYIACLDAGYPFAVSVPGGSDAWQSYSGSDAIGPVPAEQSELDHEVLCIGYRVQPNGQLEYEVLNSWDDTYGDSGHIWITQAAMAQCADQAAMKVSLAS